MPHYAIGDIQGCYSELHDLLTLINFSEQDDTLWLTGDLVNRGPKSLQTLRFISSLKNCVCVLGNHDLHCLSLYYAQHKHKKQDTLSELLAAKDAPDLMDWLRHQPLIHDDAKLNCLMVHAGIPPGWTRQQALVYSAEVEAWLQADNFITLLAHFYGNKPRRWRDTLQGIERARYIINALTRMRFCDPEGRLELGEKGGIDNASANLIPWFTHPQRKPIDRRIVFGHWAALEGCCPTKNIEALDTGCVWGHALTAYCLETQERFSVPSRKAMF